MGTWLWPESWKYLRYFRWNHFCRFQSNWLRFWFQFQFLISPVSFFYLCNNFLIIYSGQTDLRRLSVTRYNASLLAILGLEKKLTTSASTISRKLIDLKKELFKNLQCFCHNRAKRRRRRENSQHDIDCYNLIFCDFQVFYSTLRPLCHGPEALKEFGTWDRWESAESRYSIKTHPGTKDSKIFDNWLRNKNVVEAFFVLEKFSSFIKLFKYT